MENGQKKSGESNGLIRGGADITFHHLLHEFKVIFLVNHQDSMVIL